MWEIFFFGFMDYLDFLDDAQKITGHFALDRDLISVGREVPAALVLDSKVVSREHGALRRAGPYLYFQDYGSTNGSWLNGEKLSPQRRYLLRDKDALQIGNVLTRVRRESPFFRPTLVVLRSGEYIGDHPLAASGVVLIIGEGNEYYPLEGNRLVFQCRRAELSVIAEGEDCPAIRNGVRFIDEKTLLDRDEVRVDQYAILAHLPDFTGSLPIETSYGSAGQQSSVSGKTRTITGGFGRLRDRSADRTITDSGDIFDDDEDTTISSFGTLDTRRTVDDATGGYQHKAFEQKVIFGVGVFLLGMLFMLFVWWVLG
jgi:hypothetical protein